MKYRISLAASLFALLAGPLRADTVIVFNEIMYHPATNEPTMEWVELRNQMAVDVDISDWFLDGGIQYTFPANTIVRGGGFLVVAISPSTLSAATGLTGVLGPFTGRLGNNGDTLRLRNNSGRVVDEVTYGTEDDWPVAPDGSGASLAKLDRDSASGPARNWVASEQLRGTPGEDNFPFLGSRPPDTRLIGVSESWKFNDAGTDLGTGWREPGFSDAAWGARSSFTNLPIATLFNTGVDANKVALPAGSADPHYILTAAAQGTVGASAMVEVNNAAWLANDAASAWIGVVNNGATGVAQGNYDFQTTFSLAGFIPSTVQVNIVMAADNSVANVMLNGAATGLSYVGFAAWSGTNTLNSGFISGVNTLEFRTVNDPSTPNPAGFRALLSGAGLAANPNSPMVSGRTTYYFRKSFTFAGDPSFTNLRLNTLLADGAVFYLNGVEVHRQNMPAGPISFGTPATADVPTPAYSGFVSIPAASLVAGVNVLAVEVHQAAGGQEGALLGVELTATPLPAPPVTLTFNELSASTNAEFWLELVNHGTNTLALEAYALQHDGASNRVYVFPPGTPALSPGGFLALTNTTLGFRPDSGDRLYLLGPDGLKVLDGVVVKKRGRGRSPEGTGRWLDPDVPTPAAPNSFDFRDEIVINEIMYRPALLPGTNGLPPQPSPEAWVELFNRSSNTVDLTGWELDGGIRYHFTPGQTLAPGGYLVVADDAAFLRTLYPALAIVGNFSGRLSGKSDLLVLKDPLGNPADEVRYFDGGAWPGYANGGSSSLELRDPRADNARAEAWAASDESRKTGWQTYTYRMVANIPAGSGQPTTWNDFIFGLLGAGECLIDDLTVIETPGTTPVAMVANGNFENGLTGWRAVGNHGRSRVETDPDNPGNHVLRLVATGPQEHMHNHLEATTMGQRPIVSGREYEISFRARWLAGNNFLNTRLYFNRVARTTVLPRASLNGTPGAPNSRLEANIGPTFSQLSHQPVVPQASEPVTVSVIAQDPQGVNTAQVWWSVNGGAWSSAAMTHAGSGRYTGTIPGYSAGAIVQFYVRAVDGLGAAATYPADGPDSGALYMVADGQANFSLGHNVRIILTPANRDLLHAFTNVMSNAKLPATVIYDERRAYYDTGVRLKGSERGRYSDTRVSFHIEFPPDDLFRGVHPVMLVDRSGAGDTTSNKQLEIVIKHMLNRAGGIPGTYPDICRVIAPRSLHTGPAIFSPRHEDDFIETAFDNGGDGTLWELELIYYPTTTNQFGYKNPNPDAVIGTDIQNLGDDKEIYRYNFMIKNHRDADDYAPFIAFAKSLSLTGNALDAATRPVMDVNEWMRVWALVTLCGVGDSYTFGNNHNLFMYRRPSDNRILAFPVDMDFSFTRGATAALVGDQNLSKVINLTPNLRLFYGHIVDIINSTYNSTYMARWPDHYDNFCPGQNFTGSLNYIQQRGDHARNVIGAANINNPLTLTSPTNVITGSNLVTLTGTAPVTVRALKINGQEYPVTWTSLTGWTMQVPLSAISNALLLTAFDVMGRPLPSFERTLNVTYTNAIPEAEGTLAINEIMYHPAAPEASYVELFNTSSHYTFDLSNWRFNGLSFNFPSGSFIRPRQYVVLAKNVTAYLAAYGTNAPLPLATYDGVLQNDGETLTLFKPGIGESAEAAIDKVRYESALPWPAGASGTGSSLQLIDPAQDHSRPANWFSDYRVSYTNYDWRQISITATMGTLGRVLVYLSEPGDVYLDDLSLVVGTNAGVGSNWIRNGDFESPLRDDPALTNSFVIPTNYTNTALSTEIKHRGNSSLHLIASTAGTALNRVLYQNLSPAPSNTTVCTLSFWYLPTTTASNLNVRIQNSSLTTLTSIRPNFVPDLLYATPGRANLTDVGALSPIPPLWLNEVQAENLTGPLDAAGHRVPWIELYNAGPNVESLEGLHLSDNYTNLAQWAFPTGAVLQPGEFKVVFADGATGESTASEWHTSFTLTPGSGSVALARFVDGRAEVLDYVNYRNVRPDRSYGSYPDGQLFERREFYRPTPGRTNDATAAPLVVFINEWMADNTRTLLNTNNSNRADDWFELYNPTDEPASLQGYYLTDNLGNRFQFAIPAGFVVPARGFLHVWADNLPGLNNTNVPELHVNFRLDQDGEAIGLFAGDGTLIDGVTFVPQFADISEGRYADGATERQFMPTPTPRAPNVRGNTLPMLAAIPNFTSPPGQLLTFTASASDPEAPPQTLRFSLAAGAPAGATIHPVSGVFQWVPATSNLASTVWITVRVTDNGTPALSASRTFAVLVQETLELSGITRLPDGRFTFTLSVTPGGAYRVEYKDDLSAPEWTPQPPDLFPTGNTLTITNQIEAIPQRFFRVRQLE